MFGLKGALIERKVTPGGVEQLIDAIASHIDMRRQQSAEGDRQIIRAGIEDKTFRYGTSSWNFRSLYQTELVPWMQSAGHRRPERDSHHDYYRASAGGHSRLCHVAAGVHRASRNTSSPFQSR